jgi:hypothetical protein
MLNTSPTTGVRYGVISCASLNQDLVNEQLSYGPGAKDLSYAEAYAEAKKDAERRADQIEEEVKTSAAEQGVIDAELENWLEQATEAAYERLGYADRDDLINCDLEKFSDLYQCDEPVIEGEYEGVKYRISWLGGAPLLWVLEGPIGYAARLCSPCVPNAADLDGGFFDLPRSEIAEAQYPHQCYVVPRDWLASTTD